MNARSVVESGDMSPLSHDATCRAVPKRGHVLALQSLAEWAGIPGRVGAGQCAPQPRQGRHLPRVFCLPPFQICRRNCGYSLSRPGQLQLRHADGAPGWRGLGDHLILQNLPEP